MRATGKIKSFLIQQFFKNVGEVWASSPHLRSKSNCMIYCPLLQTTVLFAVPLKAAAKPLALRGQYERRLLVAKPPPAIHCRYCKTVDFAIEPSITRAALCVIIFSLLHLYCKSISKKSDRTIPVGFFLRFLKEQCGEICYFLNFM